MVVKISMMPYTPLVLNSCRLASLNAAAAAEKVAFMLFMV